MEETIVLDNEVLVCTESAYAKAQNFESTVEYFVVCKKGQQIGSNEAYECLVAGEKIVNWVKNQQKNGIPNN